MVGVFVVVLLIIVLSAGGALVYFHIWKKSKASKQAQLEKVADENTYKVSYAPPQFEWSGHSAGALPVKTLSYKQYDCLEDARYGFRIVGVHPSARDQPQRRPRGSVGGRSRVHARDCQICLGPDGHPVELSGRFTDVVRQQAGGEWLFVIDNPYGVD